MINWKDYERKESLINIYTGVREDVVTEWGSLGYEDTIEDGVRIHYEVFRKRDCPLYQIKCWIPAIGLQLVHTIAEIASMDIAKELVVSASRDRIEKIIPALSSITTGRIP
jgi:hypothetical protein